MAIGFFKTACLWFAGLCIMAILDMPPSVNDFVYLALAAAAITMFTEMKED
jgi:hypothetical protein